MLELLYIDRNRSVKQVIDFFKEQGIMYKERKMDQEPLTKEEIIELHQNIQFNDSDELLKRQTKIWETLDRETITFNAYIDYLTENNHQLKQPILRDRERMHYFMGCESEGLRMFIPRKKKIGSIHKPVRKQKKAAT